jgi:hypothetical protein
MLSLVLIVNLNDLTWIHFRIMIAANGLKKQTGLYLLTIENDRIFKIADQGDSE